MFSFSGPKLAVPGGYPKLNHVLGLGVHFGSSNLGYMHPGLRPGWPEVTSKAKVSEKREV